MNIIYFILVLLSTTIGAISGFGGGMIIKPVLDAISPFDTNNIGLYSSFAVFSMTLISTGKQIKQRKNFNYNIICMISIGSIFGGLIGQEIFTYIKHMVNNDAIIKIIQSILLLLVFILIFLYTIYKKKIKTHHVKNLFALVFMGVTLGASSVFLGIGGGALDIVVMSYFFSFEMKDAVVYSLATILFAQVSKLVMILFFNDLSIYSFTPVPYIVIAGVLGGLLGAQLRKKISNSQTELIFKIVMALLILLTSYNAISRIM